MAVIRLDKFVLPMLLICLAGPLRGQTGGLLADRPTLNALLGGSGFTETFGGYFLAPGTALNTGASSLDSTSIINSQGPNLVSPGLTFTGTSLQFDAAGWYNAVSSELLFNGNTMNITFASPTIAFGLDVRDFAGYSSTMTVTIYAPNDTTVLNTYSGISLSNPAVFFGYQDPGGIGMVTLSGSGSWSPIITNLTFVPIPEPGTDGLMAGGLAIMLAVAMRRRKSAD